MHAIRPVLAVVAALFISACASDYEKKSVRADQLIASSYSGVDYLLQTSKSALDPAQPVLIATLANDKKLDDASSFGRVIAEQIASRIVNSGYKVEDVRLRSALLIRKGSGEFVLSRDVETLRRSSGAQAIVAGTYTVAEHTVYLNIKLLSAADGRVLAAYDYTLDKTDDVRYLLGRDAADVVWYN